MDPAPGWRAIHLLRGRQLLVTFCCAARAPGETAVYNFCTALLQIIPVSDATFAALGGERGVVEVLAAMGYYQIVSMVVNANRYPLAEGSKPEMRPLTNPIP